MVPFTGRWEASWNVAGASNLQKRNQRRIHVIIVIGNVENGDPLPQLVGRTVNAQSAALHDLIRDRWSVVFFYRGHW